MTKQSAFHHYIFLCIIGLLVAFTSACTRPTVVEKIQQEKVLHVITRNAPTIYYQEKDGAAGFEYDLAKLFADRLGVELRLRVATNMGEVTHVLENGFAHFGSAGLAATDNNAKVFRFSPPYLYVSQQLVYRLGTGKPKSFEDIQGQAVWTVAGSHHVETLQQLGKQYPTLEWVEADDMDTSDLLRLIEEEKISYALVDSNELEMFQALYPHARPAFDASQPQPHVWYFPPGEDNTLVDLANQFFLDIDEDGTLLQLKERYYGHLDQLNYVGARTYIRHISSRLPQYQGTFEKAGEEYDIDWRLLAAIGYQESHWRAKATSPTGVRGLMMLTRGTAKDMGIKNRLDPNASIRGGAKYFSKIYKKIPKRIQDPDRTWFALASYNVGFGHVEDARILAEKDGKDPDKWVVVKEYLPLLSKKKWYKQTKYGYARGYEPVAYVQNIRRYYDVLSWMSQPQDQDGIVAKNEPDSPLSSGESSTDVDSAFEELPPML